MKHTYLRFLVSVLPLLAMAMPLAAQDNVIDEVIWVVGDEPILRSEVEFQRINAEMNGQRIAGDPYTVIPEQLAINKLFLHQAAIDSIIVTESDVKAEADYHLEYMINMAGSQEKLEEYRGMTIRQIRQELVKSLVEGEKVRQAKRKIVGSHKTTPAEVRRYFKNMPIDSLPFIPTQVEVQILTSEPDIPAAEIDRVKEQLQEYARRINAGEASFSSLARLYSQDEGSARIGGELDYSSRAEFVPEFSNVAFALTDKNTISKIVKTEYGYHIIQLIDRRGEKIKCRHILLRPEVPDDAIEKCLTRLDSITADIKAGKFTFNEAVVALSDDKDTRNNFGLMKYRNPETFQFESRFQMKDLPQDVAKVVDGMQVGEISKPFSMINAQNQRVCAIVLLKNRIDAHRADITEDFQVLSNIVAEKKNEEVIVDWIKEKQRTTYISIKEGWRRDNFRYPGWIK